MEIFQCLGSGGFGVFFSNSQIHTLLTHLVKDADNFTYDIRIVTKEKETEIKKDEVTSKLNSATNKIKELLKAIGRSRGVKMLRTKKDFQEEIDGLKTAVNKMGITYVPNTQGELFGFGIETKNVKNLYNNTSIIKKTNNSFNFCYKNGGRVGQLNSYSLYFILMDQLHDVEQEMKKHLITNKLNLQEYNTFCLESIVYPLVSQLNTMMKNGIYHRDIKPPNIMFQKKGRLMEATFIDYGMMSTTLEIGGGSKYYFSPGYAAFEARGKTLTDIFNGNNSLIMKYTDLNNDNPRVKNVISCLNPENLYDAYKGISWHTFLKEINTTQFKTLVEAASTIPYENLKRYILGKQDQYALGLSIQEICMPPFPMKYDLKLHLYSLQDISRKMHVKYSREDAMNMRIENKQEQYTTNFIEVKKMINTTKNGGVYVFPDPQKGGGKITKKKKITMKKFVLGKERVVFRKAGEKGLFLKFRGKVVPLKDARQLEKRIEKIKERYNKQ